MANFQTAIKWLKEGRKVRRKDWGNKELHGTWKEDFISFFDKKGSTNAHFLNSIETLEADDWEIYEDDEITKIIDKWLEDYKTSWKYLKRKGYIDAERDGDCVFLNSYDCNAIGKLRDALGRKNA